MRLLWFVSLSFLTMMIAEACQQVADQRRYCAFTPEARMIMNAWLQDRGLGSYFTRENVTVVTNACVGTAGGLQDIDKIVMRVPAAVWFGYRNRLLKKSACTIIGQTLSGAGLGAMSGFVGAGRVKWYDFSLTDAFHSAVAGAVAMGTYGAISGVYNVLETAEIRCIDREKELKSRASHIVSDMVTLDLRDLIVHTSIFDKIDCMSITTPDNEDRLFLSYSDKAPSTRDMR